MVEIERQLVCIFLPSFIWLALMSASEQAFRLKGRVQIAFTIDCTLGLKTFGGLGRINLVPFRDSIGATRDQQLACRSSRRRR